MASKVSKIANLCMDSFYQDFKPASAFLRKEHFIMFVIAADAKLKQDEYNLQVSNNMRKRTPNAQVNLSSDNYITVKDIAIQKEKAILPTPIMMFPGTSASVSVTEVLPEGNCMNIMPLAQSEKWQARSIKDIVFWWPTCEGIEFLHLKENCDPKKTEVTYVPVLNKDSVVNESRVFAILNMVTIFIKSAKEGVVIDTTNDQNPNVLSQTEINKYVLKAMKG